jgi:hypothetical protein
MGDKNKGNMWHIPCELHTRFTDVDGAVGAGGESRGMELRSVSTLHRRRRLHVGDDMAAAVEHALAVSTGVGGRHRQGQLGHGGAGLLLAVVLALTPDEGVEPHHYDRRANHTATARTRGKKKGLISASDTLLNQRQFN